MPIFSRTFNAPTMQSLANELTNVFETNLGGTDNGLFSIRVEGLVERDISNNESS